MWTGDRRRAAAWISGASQPWVTQTSCAPVSSRVRFNSSQSAWSEMISGSSAPLARARARTRIQPEAATMTGATGPGTDDPGGASTIAPARPIAARSVAAATGRRSPSATPHAT